MNDFEDRESLRCDEAIRLLDHFLADQIDMETKVRLADHLEVCDACREETARRRAIRETLRSSWTTLKAPESLGSRIRDDIEKSPRSSFGFKQMAAAAACLFVAVALVLLFVTRGPSLDDSHQFQIVNHFDEVAADHLRCTGQVTSRSNLPLDPYFDQIESNLQKSPLDLQLLGIMDCQVQAAEFLHYVFRGNEGLFSMMLEHREFNERLPNSGHVVELEGEAVRTIEQGPLIIASLVSPEHFVYLTGDELSEDELLEVAARILEPLRLALGRELAFRSPVPLL